MRIDNEKDARTFITAWASHTPGRRTLMYRIAAEGVASAAAICERYGHKAEALGLRRAERALLAAS